MHPDWWTPQGDGPGTPWLRIPPEERTLGNSDPLGRLIEDPHTRIGPSWQAGHTLYTLVEHDAVTGARALYALRSSGTLHHLLPSVPAEHLYGAWLLLTSPSAPEEPLAQLVFEFVVEESWATPSPLENLDAIERRRYLQARDLNARGLEEGIAPTVPDPERDMPDGLRLEARTAEERAAAERWLHALEADLDLPAFPEPPAPRPADPALEDAFDLRPPTGWAPRPLTTGNAGSTAPDTPVGAARPHVHRGDDDLTRALRSTEWAMWQADRRARAASLGADSLRVEAVAGRGPQSAALERRRHRVQTAAGLMRRAQDAEANRVRAARAAVGCRRQAAAFEALALGRRWRAVLRGQWPPVRRRRLHRRAEARRADALTLDTLAGEYGEDVRRHLDEARRTAPESRDPLGDADVLAAALPRLREEAVAADCLSVAPRREALRQEEKSARSLRQWHEYGARYIRREMRRRQRGRGVDRIAVPPLDGPAQPPQ
ncbi:hypothetical protein ACFC58_39650 [Kitasatospora purpeofusca]|uniref:hypothetical protein n=1 Tax=Kitasatospora purpeofusca TaxID=67352 RepID=UPI0035D5AA47